MSLLKIICIPLEDSSQAYSRLDSGNTNKAKPSLPKRTSMWFLNKAVPSISSHSLSKSISKMNSKIAEKEEMEKEWLLLGEASSPVNRSNQDPLKAESSILSDTTTSDTECIVKAENSDSETSDEDIDSIVEEFQQKVKVSTAGLKETNLKVPSTGSWKLALLCIFSVSGSCVTAAISASYEWSIPFTLAVAGIYWRFDNFYEGRLWLKFNFPVVFVMSIAMWWIPRYTYSHETPAILTCTISFLFNSILFTTMMFDSWCAIIFWLLSGIILAMQSMVKCDIWCCLCLDSYPSRSTQSTVLMEESLLPNGSARMTTATIRLKNPPIGTSVINHVQQSRRWHIDSSVSESDDYEEDTVEEWTEWDN